jgi:hypothetical protein
MERTIDREMIEKQAKEILDKFAKALEKVEKNSEIESYVDRNEFERKEKIGSDSKESEDSKNVSFGVNPDFKKRILDNSPSHDDDFIIGETGGWK